MKKEHIGSDFDDFLQEEDLLDAVEATAAKRVIAFQIAQKMNVSDFGRLAEKWRSVRSQCRDAPRGVSEAEKTIQLAHRTRGGSGMSNQCRRPRDAPRGFPRGVSTLDILPDIL